MHLSKRLKMAADCVTKGSRTADVGCDHAYLSIYLVNKGIVPSVISMDINEGPLKHARENIVKYRASDRIELRLSDGLNKLQPFEADTIVLAGIGGELMVSILKKGLLCVEAAKELVLQPQSEVYKVRRFLLNAGYNIIYEDMCIDYLKYYVVIKAVNTGKVINDLEIDEENTYNNLTADDVFGGFLLTHKNDILYEYLNKEIIINREIQDKLIKYKTDKALKRLYQCKADEERIKEALKYYDE